jgi:tryptophanyl-tRNA synthetase
VLEHAELHLLLSMVTPLSWLERVPTYKEQIENLRERDLGTYGFLGYPLLQTADIVLYGEPDRVIEVPVGEDQVPHVELAREVVRRFNTQFGFEVRIPAGKATDTVRLLEKVGVKQSAIDAAAGHDERVVLFRKRALEIGMANFLSELGEDKKYFRVGQVLREPDVKLTETPRLPGTDGRRMAKSYGNAIWLSEPVEDIRKKVRNMLTDPQRVRRTDPGRPEICPVFYYHRVFSDAGTVAEIDRDCRTAGIGCVDCKSKMADGLVRWIEPIQERRKEFEAHPGKVWDILDAGSKRAGVTAKRTMKRVRDAIFDWDSVRTGR